MQNKPTLGESHKVWRHHRFAAYAVWPTVRPRSARRTVSTQFCHKFQRRPTIHASRTKGSRYVVARTMR
eukprot:4361979-Pleurochrysis_carterae.AAC.1